MTDLYTNLLKATDNTSDITTEKYGTVVKIDGTLCSVKEYDTELEHSNVPIVNGADLKLGDKVIIGFLNNSIYDTVCYGVLDRTVETDWDNVKDKPTVFPTDWENVKDKPSTFPPSRHNHVSSEVTDLINTIYPIGSIYMSVSDVSPSILFGGEWEQIEDKFLLASGTSYSNGSTGGSADAVVVTHNHSTSDKYVLTTKGGAVTRNSTAGTTGTKVSNLLKSDDGVARNVIGNTGTSGVGKNMPPYLAVNIWKRTA